MTTRERVREETGPGGTPSVPVGGSGLGEIRAAADELLAAGDEAIRRALSSDHEAFNQANRQQSGQ